ncbi:MAG: hypothetical protein J5618_02890, partial [Bacilli bacterium]|nr:hypothetical protein [Bacilli bacterium]
MKSLFIYYSYTGNGEVVAEYFAKHNVELRKVEIAKKLPKSFFWGMMTGGFLAGRKYKDKLVDFDNVLGHRTGILGCSTAEMKMSLS